uniref:PHD finger protein 8 n=1 Tax=Rousettus aegyptiacus TaxID=9407 RepID=A0A7J8EL91_ROUAE|nr:PHD finger protein 8 [Rousettus aegyptiacus]
MLPSPRPLPLPALKRPSRACCAWPTCSPHHPPRLPPACRVGGPGDRTEAVGAPAVGWAQCLAVLLPNAPWGSGPSSGQHTGELRVRRRRRTPVWMNRTAWEHASRMQSIFTLPWSLTMMTLL